MDKRNFFIRMGLIFIFLNLGSVALASPPVELQLLKESYPSLIQDVSSSSISWRDGSSMPVRGSAFWEKLSHLFSSRTTDDKSISIMGLRCDSYEPFFKKMYGGTMTQVKQKLVTVYWMPKVFGYRYPLRVTTVNGVDKKIQRISAELEKLPPSYYKYVSNPAGAFYWRTVKRERYLSAHSFGIAMDINSHYGNYWMWDRDRGRWANNKLVYHNNIPMKIVEIFEQEGFLWGGRWYFYDTMHFEYRPEMFKRNKEGTLVYNNQLGMRCDV